MVCREAERWIRVRVSWRSSPARLGFRRDGRVAPPFAGPPTLLSPCGRFTWSSHCRGRSTGHVRQRRHVLRHFRVPPAPQARPSPIFCSLDQVPPARRSAPRNRGPSADARRPRSERTCRFPGRDARNRRPAMQMPTPDVRRREPLHERPQLAVVLRPEHKVPMVRHNQVAQNPHRLSRQRFAHHPLESCIVGVLGENPRPRICAVEHVKNHPPRSYAGCSRHGLNLPQPASSCQ